MKQTITFLAVLLVPFLLFSQEKQPKIGLVLSGGGAKGFAHIGVLKEIEKAGLQIDYIGGTSMGAIIGGLYAVGYSAIEIEDIVTKTNLVQVLQDQLPRNSKPYFEKEFGEKHAITLPVVNGKIQLPRAISKGQRVLDLFNYLLTPVDSITEFKNAQIPFFCIATDAETGEGILLETGSLPLALRASGSFPTLLNPVDVDGRLLIDGGVADNFPIDIMKQKGVDYIIGVDVQSKLNKKGKLNSVVSILNQIVSYEMYKMRDIEKKMTDLYIKPDISDYTVVDFDKSIEIIKKGEEVAVGYRKVFDSIAAKQPIKRKRGIENKNTTFKVKAIKVLGTKNFTPAFVRGRLNLQIGDELTKRDLIKRVNFLTATENYDQITYKISNDTVSIFVKEKKEKASLRLGAHYDQLYQSGILANYINKSLLINNDELSIDLVLGDKIRYNLNYFVDNGFYISYGFKSRYNHFRANTIVNLGGNSNLNKINLNYTDFSNEFFVQTTFGRIFAIGMGVEHKYLKMSTETVINPNSSNNELIFDDSHYFNLLAYIKLDSYDDSVFPTKGFFADLGGKWYVSSTDYSNNFNPFPQIGGSIGFATTFGERLTFQYTNDAGFTFTNPNSDVYDYILGGYNQNYINNFKPMYGYEFAQLSGNSFLRSEFAFRYRILDNHYAMFIANYARVDDNVFKDGDLFKNVLSGYAVGYSFKTLIGPIELKYSWSPENNENFWLFNLGFWF